MVLFDGGLRDVAARFVTAQPDQQGFPAGHPVKRQTGPDECHGASLGGDVEFPITNQFFWGYKTQGFLPFKTTKRIAKRLRLVL